MVLNHAKRLIWFHYDSIPRSEENGKAVQCWLLSSFHQNHRKAEVKNVKPGQDEDCHY